MTSRKFSLMHYFNARCRAMEPLFAFSASTEKDARAWRARAFAKIRDLVGEMPDSIPLEAEIVDATDCGNYIREKIIFDSDPDASVPAYLLIPKNADKPLPAVVCIHGPGPGKDVVAGVTNPDQLFSSDQKARIIREHNYDYARQLAEHGYLTITFDLRCFGERTDLSIPLNKRNPCNVYHMCGSLLGINLLALAVHDTIRAIDYLQERTEVDPKRIGCVGLISGGGLALWTAAFDKRVKAAVAAGCIAELETFALLRAEICEALFVPAMRRYFDLADLAALMAPRPLLIESGIQDEVFPIESAKRSFERVKQAYNAWKKPEQVAHHIFDGGARFETEAAVEWFDKWL